MMKESIELPLRTREVNQLFNRKIKGDRLFIEAILHKFNFVINRCQKEEPQALLAYQQIKQKMQELTQQFGSETAKLELLLTKKKSFDSNKITYAAQFYQRITVSNPLAIQLVKLIEVYDKLVTVVKLLHLAGCFETGSIYFENIKRIQKLANQILSCIMLSSSKPFIEQIIFHDEAIAPIH